MALIPHPYYRYRLRMSLVTILERIVVVTAFVLGIVSKRCRCELTLWGDFNFKRATNFQILVQRNMVGGRHGTWTANAKLVVVVQPLTNVLLQVYVYISATCEMPFRGQFLCSINCFSILLQLFVILLNKNYNLTSVVQNFQKLLKNVV